MPLVTSGVEHGNLRELALARMRDLGTQVSLATGSIAKRFLLCFQVPGCADSRSWYSRNPSQDQTI